VSLRVISSIVLFAVAMSGGVGGCRDVYRAGAHDLAPTGGQVKFATSSTKFYQKKWHQLFRAQQPKICAGFVHSENFKRYLKYGNFQLAMRLEVYKGGRAVHKGDRIVDWRGGRLLKTLKKNKAIQPRQNSYVWCGGLRQNARWKVGAMKFTFTLRRKDPPKVVPIASGIVQITP
jgi:hypothetical protein